jgi:hypothetical protein
MPSRSLPETQAEFLRCLFSGDAAPDQFPAQDAARFSVYRSAVFANLREALRAVFPVIERLTGGEFFDQAARRFVRDHPSTNGDLHRYGAQFPAFLASFEPAAALPYLADVARLEWLWHEAFHAADHGPPQLARLAAIPPSRWPDLRLKLQPACRMLHSPYPVHRIWQVNQPEHQGDESVDLDEGEARLLLYRAGYEVVVAPLSVGEFRFVEALSGEDSVARALEAALARQPTLDAGALLRDLVGREIIVDFSVS